MFNFTEMSNMSTRMTDNNLHDLLMQAPVTFMYLTGPNLIILFANKRILEFMGMVMIFIVLLSNVTIASPYIFTNKHPHLT